MKKRCCFNWVGLLNPVGLLIWWWARDINMQSDLMQCKLGPVCMTVMSLSQQYAGKGTCKSVRYPVHVYLFFCTHSTCSMVLTPVLFVDSREWACCHFDTSSLWWLTSPSAHILFESGKVMPSWDMLNFNTYSIKHLNMSCHPKGRTRSHVVDFFQINRNQQLNFGNTPIAFSTTLALVVVQNICILHNPKPPLRWQRAFSQIFPHLFSQQICKFKVEFSVPLWRWFFCV